MAISSSSRGSTTSSWLPVGLGALAILLLSNDQGPILCPWRRCTDGYCPLCGATRSVGSFVKLDFGESLRRFPALPLLALYAASQFWSGAFPKKLQNRILVGVALATTAIWIARIAAGEIPGPSTLKPPW